MSTLSTNFSIPMPAVNSATDEDLWGALLNSGIVIIDTEIFKCKIKGKETIFVPAGAMSATVSNGCSGLTSVETTADRPDMIVLDFDQTSAEYAQFQVAFPKSWDEGTVTFQAFWTTAAATAGTVIWQLEGVAVGNDDTIDVAYGTAQTSTDTALGTAEDLHVSPESSAITIAGSPAVDEMCFFRIGRQAADTHASDARLIGIKLFFTTDGRSDD